MLLRRPTVSLLPRSCEVLQITDSILVQYEQYPDQVTWRSQCHQIAVQVAFQVAVKVGSYVACRSGRQS